MIRLRPQRGRPPNQTMRANTRPPVRASGAMHRTNLGVCALKLEFGNRIGQEEISAINHIIHCKQTEMRKSKMKALNVFGLQRWRYQKLWLSAVVLSGGQYHKFSFAWLASTFPDILISPRRFNESCAMLRAAFFLIREIIRLAGIKKEMAVIARYNANKGPTIKIGGGKKLPS